MKRLVALLVMVAAFSAKASVMTFDESDIGRYGSQSVSGGHAIFDGGAGLEVFGNNWVTHDLASFPSLVNRTLSFDFMLENLGEIHGIGFDNDAKLQNGALVFQLAGTQTYGIQDYLTGATAGSWYSVSIDLSQYDMSAFNRLVFIADQDTRGRTTTSYFRNLTATSAVSVPLPSSVSLFALGLALVVLRARKKA